MVGEHLVEKILQKLTALQPMPARYVAKNLVAAGLADEVLVQIAYAIGVAAPVSIDVNSYGTGTLSRIWRTCPI